MVYIQMKEITIFMADADQEHIQRTRKAIAGRQELTFMGSCGHGHMAFKRLMAKSADILLLDLQLPGMDGIALLRALNHQSKCPVCIVCTRFYSDFYVTRSVQSGADYVLYKPLDYSCLPDTLLDCCHYFRPGLFPDAVSALHPPARYRSLVALGFPARQRGTCFLREALDLLKEHPELLCNLSRGLYPAIARNKNASPACVERSIRYAINIAWEHGTFLQAFPHRPTNRELITYLLSIDLENRSSSDSFDFDNW